MTSNPPAAAPDTAAWPPLDPQRKDAGLALVDWAADVGGTRARLCLVRGGRASGKSHLIAWFFAGAAGHPRTTVHALVPAEGLFTEAFAWELGRQLGYGPLPPHRLLDRIAADQRPLLLLVPELNRAGRGPAELPQADPRRLVAELLLPLLEFPHVRLVAEVDEAAGTQALFGEPGGRAVASVDLGELPFPGAAPSRSEAADFTALFATVPRTGQGRPIWGQAPPAARDQALDRALVAGDRGKAVRTLLTDPGFLVHGSAVSITAALADRYIPLPARLREVWGRAAPQLSAVGRDGTERAALLHAAALGGEPTLAEYLRPLAERHHWSAVWARHGTPVTALAQLPGEVADLAVADPVGGLSAYAPATGDRAGAIASPAALRPYGIAARTDRALLLLDESGALQPVVPVDEEPAATVLAAVAEHHGRAALSAAAFRPTALASCPRTSLTAVGDAQGAVHVWSLGEYQPQPRSWQLHRTTVLATAAVGVPGEGLELVFSAGADGSVRMWEASGEPMEGPVEQRPAAVTALAAADTAAGPVLAVAWDDAEIHLWQVLSGRVGTVPLLYRCAALALDGDGQLTVGGPDGMYAIRLGLDRLWG